jgi:DNA repair exonuclease SbcCD ATPase subunit
LKSKRATAERSVKLYETRIQEISDEVTRIETALDVLRDKFNKGDGYFNKESNDYIDLDKPEVRQALITDNEEHIADVNCILDELHRLEEEMTSTSGRKQEAVRSLKEWKRKVKEQEDLIAGLGSTKIWFERCEKAISWFKKDGLPRLIHRSILKQLTTIINTELESFGKPFSVEVNDDLTFTATFPNGVIMNSRALSDGQKVMLAMAFWIAVNRTFAQNIGIMILDEPTSGLDSVNSACLYGILERLKKSLHQRGQQVVIITFDEEMTSVLDEVYHVVKPEDNL